MKVVVIGAGIGGLVLAHGLRAAGVEVTVFERDRAPADTGGYRLHLDAEACEILDRRLPPAVCRALRASAADPASFTRFSVWDHRLRPLLHFPRRPTPSALLIGRIPLRTLLCEGLHETVRFGREFTRSSVSADGKVTAYFAKGAPVQGDLLIGADGARSRVAPALAGRPTAHPLTARGVAGRTPLTTAVRRLLPPAITCGPGFAIGPGGTGMFLSAHTPGTEVEQSDIAPVLESPYLLWGITTTEPETGEEHPLEDAQALLHRWSPAARALLDLADPASGTSFPYFAADPTKGLMPWPAGRVTALGDAVHAMPPTGGRGAATAVRDADLLTERIIDVHRGVTPVNTAMARYQGGVEGYAHEALRESLQPLIWQRRLRHPLAYHVARPALKVTGAAIRLRSALAGSALRDRGGEPVVGQREQVPRTAEFRDRAVGDDHPVPVFQQGLGL
ncbi:NAD(P)/FAD-dependent oxidoreductase [Amycolatopsis sp. QT-25]|uniref:FAD-dependent oxidoreductase n=1 Tax=Amycolatopsis sp. QT-25 TaxID=3034022 RepID=UPI0023EBA21B|nr:NAD(P)/FAD-dependent oxidoreductase [Amycolatopsis sp. QT-25]WET76796.1 NAD(P)/FAD-dependent oxidoreductase [Amycolatopsis sp. QT-25]